jgi:hypothetical protein
MSELLVVYPLPVASVVVGPGSTSEVLVSPGALTAFHVLNIILDNAEPVITLHQVVTSANNTGGPYAHINVSRT